MLLLILAREIEPDPRTELYIFGMAMLCLSALVIMLIADIFSADKNETNTSAFNPDSLPEALIVSGVNGTIHIINAAAKRLFEYTPEQRNIKTLFERWHGQLVDRDQADQVVDAVMAAPDIQFSDLLHLQDGRSIERSTRPSQRQGQRVWVLRDITHMQTANSDRAMHTTMVEADAARTAEMAEQLYHAKAELEAKQAELTRLANTDSLTGLLNRRRFTALGEEAVEDGKKKGVEIWVLMMDIDHFKRINDTYGHAAGDVAIRDFAELIQSVVADRGFIGRMGGEEFATILPGMTRDDAVRLAEKVRRSAAQHYTVSEDEKFRFTVSIGVAQWLPKEVTIEPSLDRADQALYSAKTYGRNRVVGFEYASL